MLRSQPLPRRISMRTRLNRCSPPRELRVPGQQLGGTGVLRRGGPRPVRLAPSRRVLLQGLARVQMRDSGKYRVALMRDPAECHRNLWSAGCWPSGGLHIPGARPPETPARPRGPPQGGRQFLFAETEGAPMEI